MIELVDFNDVYTNKEEAKKKSTRRGKAKKAADAPVDEVTEETIEAADSSAGETKHTAQE
jgi:large subunit ribosomal protein L17